VLNELAGGILDCCRSWERFTCMNMDANSPIFWKLRSDCVPSGKETGETLYFFQLARALGELSLFAALL